MSLVIGFEFELQFRFKFEESTHTHTIGEQFSEAHPEGEHAGSFFVVRL